MITAKDIQTILSTAAADYDIAICVDNKGAYGVSSVFISSDQKLVILAAESAATVDTEECKDEAY